MGSFGGDKHHALLDCLCAALEDLTVLGILRVYSVLAATLYPVISPIKRLSTYLTSLVSLHMQVVLQYVG